MKLNKRLLAKLNTIDKKLNNLRCELRDLGHDDEDDDVMVFLGNAQINIDEAYSAALPWEEEL